MRKFVITVNSQKFDVEVEEVSNSSSSKTTVSQKKVSDPKSSTSDSVSSPSVKGAKSVTSPMPGNIFKVLVNPGDQVKKGQTLLVLEAMKMENEINAITDGKILDVKVKVGQVVTMGQVLVEFA